MQGGVAADLMLTGKAGGSQGVARRGFIPFGQPTSIGAHNHAKLTTKVPQRGSAFAAAARQVGRQCGAGPPPVRKINSKGPPFSMRGARAIAANPGAACEYQRAGPGNQPELLIRVESLTDSGKPQNATGSKRSSAAVAGARYPER